MSQKADFNQSRGLYPQLESPPLQQPSVEVGQCASRNGYWCRGTCVSTLLGVECAVLPPDPVRRGHG